MAVWGKVGARFERIGLRQVPACAARNSPGPKNLHRRRHERIQSLAQRSRHYES